MSKPLIVKRETVNAASAFHRAVFAAWGNRCYFGWDHGATDAAHIQKRAGLGSARYACPIENGRPVCRKHHNLQETGELEFALRDRIAAVKALNKVLKIPLPLPTSSRRKAS